MTTEQAMCEFDEIVRATGALADAKNMPLAEIVALMARVQTSLVKIVGHLTVEVERLKAEGGKR